MSLSTRTVMLLVSHYIVFMTRLSSFVIFTLGDLRFLRFVSVSLLPYLSGPSGSSEANCFYNFKVWDTPDSDGEIKALL